jgi:sigma-B regulation protein RsbU (phosphoserine phosphatase)
MQVPAKQISILVVDDSKAQRVMLAATLKRWGYLVKQAQDGMEALALCKQEVFDIILSDWMMPNLTGIEFCAAFRKLDKAAYTYFILLTSKTEKNEIAHGLEIGADDFLSKPVDSSELKARIRAGLRMTKMQKDLVQKNQDLGGAYEEIKTLYDALDRDLIEAKKFQLSLVPAKFRDFGSANISLLLLSSGHVGGDMVGMFQVNPSTIGMYSIDVSGHGVSSALLTARLAGFLSSANPDMNLAMELTGDGYVPRDTAVVAAELNRRLLEEVETEHYFTIVLAIANLKNGRVELCQAGHPYTLICRKNGLLEYCGEGGAPVGLLEDMDFSTTHVQLQDGDRLVLHSDGFTECENPSGEQLGDDGFVDLARTLGEFHRNDWLDHAVIELEKFSGSTKFDDDLSLAMLEYSGNIAA